MKPILDFASRMNVNAITFKIVIMVKMNSTVRKLNARVTISNAKTTTAYPELGFAMVTMTAEIIPTKWNRALQELVSRMSLGAPQANVFPSIGNATENPIAKTTKTNLMSVLTIPSRNATTPISSVTIIGAFLDVGGAIMMMTAEITLTNCIALTNIAIVPNRNEHALTENAFTSPNSVTEMMTAKTKRTNSFVT